MGIILEGSKMNGKERLEVLKKVLFNEVFAVDDEYDEPEHVSKIHDLEKEVK